MAGPTAIYEQLTILLTLGVVSHLFIKRFRQPTIIGEIFIGILLAPSLLGRFGIFLFDQAFIDTFAALGAIFLLFLIGLETDFRAIYTRRNFFVALGGVLLPLAFGFVTAWFLAPPSAIGANGNQFILAMFVGATLTATSTAIAASVLLDLGLMREDVGRTIMGAAVVDDILGLLLLSIVVGMAQGTLDPLGVGILMAKAVAFIVVGILVGVYLFSPFVVRLQVEGLKLGVKHGGFIIAMAVAFFYSLVAETIGLSAIIGAFLAGTMFASAPLKEDFTEGTRYLEAVFTPIFFISLGLAVDVWAVWATPELFVFSVALMVVAMVTKVAGCALPARAQGMTAFESIAVGWGMTPRGEVGLIVAVTALTAGIIQNSLFSVIVLVIILVSVVPAPLFKGALQAVDRERRAKQVAPGQDAN
ncbi:MAG TPA: cation:proton antiporter [Thermoplasmata archaeon]|nr:cation:proton antiporter [Thermoplasmata archaeon]